MNELSQQIGGFPCMHDECLDSEICPLRRILMGNLPYFGLTRNPLFYSGRNHSGDRCLRRFDSLGDGERYVRVKNKYQRTENREIIGGLVILSCWRTTAARKRTDYHKCEIEMLHERSEYLPRLTNN